MTLPELFVIQMKNILGSEYSDFEAALHEKAPVSVRLNSFKPENQLPISKPVPWCDRGFYLEHRPVFTLDPFFHAGHYYVQDASSMFVDFILKNVKLKANPKILDLCSAPGGKSTLILSHLSNNGFLHCHEHDPYRMGILKQNIIRWGYPNSIITYGNLSQLERLEIRYDLILIDAPCSGEGMFRKEEDAVIQWSPKKINHCCSLQKNILSIADNLCADDGYLVYSTCTWNFQENEEILQSYITGGRYTPIKIEHEFKFMEHHNYTYTYRLFPHKIEGEGFTISVLKKQDSSRVGKQNYTEYANPKTESPIKLDHWLEDYKNFIIIPFKNKYFALNTECHNSFHSICHKVSTTHMGIPLGSWKGSDFYPSHGLSQSICLNKKVDYFAMNLNQAVEYLKALTPSEQFSTDSKWLVASYNSAKLGWLKSGGSGIKNYYPKNQRIVSF